LRLVIRITHCDPTPNPSFPRMKNGAILNRAAAV
jgi:hypothetical protein